MSSLKYLGLIDEICELPWEALSAREMTLAAWAYYYFSIQFRENLEIAVSLFPSDERLQHLRREECDTDNLSPWPGVGQAGEQMNHDEYMRRTLNLTPIPSEEAAALTQIGEAYLADIRKADPVARALSIASYEDGGLERVFSAMLRCRNWSTDLLQSYKHFLEEHIRFDSDPDQGHGALSRHLAPDDRVVPFWAAFKSVLTAAVPELECLTVADTV